MREHRMNPFVSMQRLFLYPSISFFSFGLSFVVWLFVLCDALSCIVFLSFLSELSLLSHWDPIINNPSHFNACTFTVTTILLILRCHKIGHNVGTPCWTVSHFVSLAKCTIPTAHVIFIPIYISIYIYKCVFCSVCIQYPGNSSKVILCAVTLRTNVIQSHHKSGMLQSHTHGERKKKYKLYGMAWKTASAAFISQFRPSKIGI